ncbi:MAG TPA: GTPase HflX [Thermoanaerobaculia bacterium]
MGLILPGQPGYVVEEHLDELAQLADTAGAQTVGRAMQARKAPDAATFIGKGKAEEIGETARELGADLLIFDDDLSGSQVRKLEELTKLSVMDRSALILDIFDQRAHTREARTQVELARLNYMLPRLTRQWSHLSRQGGGFGQRGGEGEKQLEQDRRLLRARIKRLEEDLEKIERTRGVQRGGRSGAPTVALTGYTNAGKSTLFNRLTSAGTLAEDRLFATLDAKLRRGSVDGSRTVVFADTVGFIRKLPHHLVSSFRSTLGEITAADVVLHVIDRSHPHWQEQAEVAEAVMEELGVERDRVVRVYNKTDLLPEDEPRNGESLWVSAVTGEGVSALKSELARRFGFEVSSRDLPREAAPGLF